VAVEGSKIQVNSKKTQSHIGVATGRVRESSRIRYLRERLSAGNNYWSGGKG